MTSVHNCTDWAKELEEADARAKAAALRLSGGYPDEAKYYVTEAKTAIAAADEVMFSDAAIERAAKAVHDSANISAKSWDERSDEIRELYREDIRIIIAALRSES